MPSQKVDTGVRCFKCKARKFSEKDKALFWNHSDTRPGWTTKPVLYGFEFLPVFSIPEEWKACASRAMGLLFNSCIHLPASKWHFFAPFFLLLISTKGKLMATLAIWLNVYLHVSRQQISCNLCMRNFIFFFLFSESIKAWSECLEKSLGFSNHSIEKESLR